ncbi:MAG: hypothetical protein HZC54_12985 [Verrucomicrobia bacterium]|nr:hypothetical protein [Verrucomicrobiota bacterium]
MIPLATFWIGSEFGDLGLQAGENGSDGRSCGEVAVKDLSLFVSSSFDFRSSALRRWFAACFQPCGRNLSGLQAGREYVRGENPRAHRADGHFVAGAAFAPAFSPSVRQTQAQKP